MVLELKKENVSNVKERQDGDVLIANTMDKIEACIQNVINSIKLNNYNYKVYDFDFKFILFY